MAIPIVLCLLFVAVRGTTACGADVSQVVHVQQMPVFFGNPNIAYSIKKQNNVSPAAIELPPVEALSSKLSSAVYSLKKAGISA